MTTHITIPPSRYERENVDNSIARGITYGDFGPSGVVVAPAGTWTHLWIDNDRISLKKKDHKVGRTKSGKKFSRYTPHSELTLNFTPNLQVFHSYRRRGVKSIHNITSLTRGMGNDRLLTPHLLERAYFLDEVPKPDYRAGQRNGYAMHLNAWIWQRLAFPILREAPHWDSVPGMAPALRQRNVQDFTRVAFGSTRYRKDLVRAIASAKTLDGTWLAHELKTTFPIDWLIPLVGVVGFNYQEVRGIKPFIRAMPVANAKRLLSELGANELHRFIVSDTLRSWAQIVRLNPNYDLGDYRFTNWREAHDHLSRELGKVEREDRKIPQTKLAKKLDGKSLDGLTLVSPKTTWELIDWGRDMHNCIGGYDRAAEAGSSVLFAVMRGDEMVGNMELTPQGGVRQLVGDHNRSLPVGDVQTVYDMIGFGPLNEGRNGDLAPF